MISIAAMFFHLVFALFICQTSATGYYALFFLPNAIITELTSTLTIPQSDGSSPGANPQGLWSGLETSSASAVLQNVVVNTAGGPGQWWLEPLGCCSPETVLSSPFEVFRGQALTSTYYSQTDGSYTDQITNSANTLLGYGVWNPAAFGSLTEAVFAIELPGPGVWDFGPLTWSNIVIVAETSNQAWCTKPAASMSFQWSINGPQAYTSGGTTWCFISSIVFLAP